MPFTPTHVLAILPLWPFRRYLPFVALATGAMVPDTPLFFPLLDYAQTHSPWGIFTVCVPLGVSLFLLIEMVCRRPLVTLSPAWLRQRIAISPQIPFTAKLSVHLWFYLGVACSVAIGALSHQVWDAFTHQGRWGTDLIPMLNNTYTLWGRPIAGYKLFQYGSTLLGLPILAILAWIQLRGVEKRSVDAREIDPRWRWAAALICMLTPVVIGVRSLVTKPSLYEALGTTIKSSGATIALLAIMFCVGYQFFMQNNDA